MSETESQSPEAPAPASAPPLDRKAARILACVVTGCAMFLGSPETSWWWLGFVGWIPWLWAIDGVRPKHAFFLGWVSGVTAITVGFWWMTELLTRFAGLPWPLAAPIHVLFASYHALAWALPALVIAWLAKRGLRRALWSAPLAWSATEVLLPNIFPTFMALMWCWQPLWIQSADIGGATTVSFTMLAINAALYELIKAYRAGEGVARVPLIAALAWLIGVPAYGALRISQTEAFMAEAQRMKIGLVQGNFGIKTYTRGNMKRKILGEMQRVSGELQAQGAEMVVWGETAYPYMTFDREAQRDLPTNKRIAVRKNFNIPILFGAITADRTRKNPYPWNTAFGMNAEGEFVGRYDKNYPLVFGEYVPLVDPEWFTDLIPSASHLNRGDGPEIITLNGQAIGPMICYEDLLPYFVREISNAGASVLINLTNDSWFGKTREQAEHLGLAVFRAVEHRRGLIRTVNAGISAYVDPTGRVVQQTEVTDSDVEGYTGAVGFVADVPMVDPSYQTVFGYTGRLFGVLCVLGIAGLAYSTRRREDETPAPAQA